MPDARQISTWLQYLMRLLGGTPAPRTYDGNPSAGCEPSTAEQDYEEAKDASSEEDHMVRYTWRW